MTSNTSEMICEEFGRFSFFFWKYHLLAKMPYEPLSLESKSSFFNRKIAAFTFDQVNSNNVFVKLKGLSNGMCLMPCLLV